MCVLLTAGLYRETARRVIQYIYNICSPISTFSLFGNLISTTGQKVALGCRLNETRDRFA